MRANELEKSSWHIIDFLNLILQIDLIFCWLNNVAHRGQGHKACDKYISIFGDGAGTFKI